MIPILRQTAERRLALPRLDGGLNVRDGVSDILDNQLTDCKNVWFERGILQTRPALELKNDALPIPTGGRRRTLQAGDSNIIFGGVRYTIVTDTLYKTTAGAGQTVTVRLFPDDAGEDVITAGTVTISDANAKNLKSRTVMHEGNVYVFAQYTTKKEVHGIEEDAQAYKVYKLTGHGDGTFEAPAEAEPYAPLILTNLWGCEHAETQAQMATRGASMIEGFNLIGNSYRMQGSTYDASDTAEQAGTIVWAYDEQTEGYVDTGRRYAIYPLLFPLPGLEGEIRLVYTAANGRTYTHSVTIYDNTLVNVTEDTEGADGLRLFATETNVGLTEEEQYTSIIDVKQFQPSDFIANNMMITAICPNDDQNKSKVFDMTKSVWFGGAARGIHGGSRLFLGGNTQEKDKALVVWSDLNNPLYFDENCYTYVGDKAQAVTAFGRQGAALVIFKERELFYTLYEQGASVSAGDVTEQNVVDVVTRSAYFPVVQISGDIGCDCPDTVQMCRNRLVWAASDGKVYELIAQNQYTERAAMCVSDVIERALKDSQTIGNLKTAHAADWRGRYLLFAGNRVFVMEYNSYGFTYAASFAKDENASARVPWYIWELPVATEKAFTAGRVLYVIGTAHEGTGVQYLDVAGGDDAFHYSDNVTATMPFDAMIQTKFFDFGSPAILKRVKLVDVSLGENGGEPVRITFLSEVTHEDAGEVTLKTRGAEEGSAESFVNKQVRPYTFACARFGIRLEAKRCMKLDKIMLTYSIFGGARWR